VLIGAHESIAGGPSRAFERAEAHGAKSLQIFTKTARAWEAPPLTELERREFRKHAKRTGLPAIAHGSYLVNLAAEDPTLRERSLRCLADELSRCERLGVRYLVIHPGAHPDPARGLALIAQALDEVHAQSPGAKAQVCLEVTAGQGNSLGHRFEHLAEILGRVKEPRRLGVCLDTCHLFAAGYDLRTSAGYERVMEELDREVGLGLVRCVHLNDSKKGLGCRVDRHEEIGKGAMGLEVFRCLVNDPRFERAIGVLETPFPERYPEAIALLQSLRS
jgi:deoxyribonuclease-4